MEDDFNKDVPIKAELLPEVVIFDFDDTLMDLNRKKIYGGEYLPRPESARVLKYLSDAGIAMGVISASKGDDVRRLVIKNKWDQYFLAVVGKGDNEEVKPSVLAWKWWLYMAKRHTTPPKSVWMVGDSDDDAKFAGEIGAEFMNIQDLHYTLFVA